MIKKAIFLLPLILQYVSAEELRWDWQTIDYQSISFPPSFLWGCADSALQTEGIITTGGKIAHNSWTEYELRNTDLIPISSRVGVACERWTRYKSDIALMKQINMNSHRFSIEWSKIEPLEGCFDQEAILHYIDMVDEMHAHGIEPVLTLFHHTYPIWFDKKRGFEKKENIKFFVRFAMYVLQHMGSRVRYWITLNEPIGYALEAYYRGNYPPGKKKLTLAGKVALNLLNAHIEIYKSFHAFDQNLMIGIAHIMQPLDPYHAWNVFEKMTAKVFNYIVNSLIIDFFKTGTFNWLFTVRDYNSDAVRALDFFGINYYTHTTIRQTNILSFRPETRFSDILLGNPGPGRPPKVMYPEGLYRSIKYAARLNIPIYITENGCSTENDDLKEEFIKKHLYVISRALQEGYDIRGYFFWTLMDCFCWRKGYLEKHGIYAVDFETQERSLRTSANYLLQTINKFNTGCSSKT